MNMLLTHTLSDFYFFFKKGAGHTWESRNGAGEKATLCRRDAVSGVVSQAAPTRCWRRDAGWILELVGGPGHLGDTWAYQTGASLGPAGCGWEQGGCWPRVLGAAQPPPRSSCRERAAFPADGCSREGRSILQRASPCPSTQRTAAFTESRKEKVQTLLTSVHTGLQRGPSGCSWMGCPGLALPPTALQTLRAGQPLLLPWKSVCTATAKKKNSQ